MMAPSALRVCGRDFSYHNGNSPHGLRRALTVFESGIRVDFLYLRTSSRAQKRCCYIPTTNCFR